MTGQIMPGERRELRTVVRAQMKVLRSEVKQRELELESEIETRLVNRYRAEDQRMDELTARIARIREDANRELREALTSFEDLSDGGKWGRADGFQTPYIYRNTENRKQLRAALMAGVAVQVKQALLALDRQEADLLRDLAIEGLETTAARAFLERIPTVGELVPSRRLREIESQFDSTVGEERIP